MSLKEMPRKSQQPEKLKSKEVLSPPQLIIILEDSELLLEHWQECLQVPGLVVLAPQVSVEYEDFDEKQQKINRRLALFIRKISVEQMQRCVALVVDQFVDNHKGHDIAHDFIEKLKKINKNVFILETSAAPGHATYDHSHRVLHIKWLLTAFKLIKKSPENPAARLQSLRVHSRSSALKAGATELEHNEFSSGKARVNSFYELKENKELARALDIKGKLALEKFSYNDFIHLTEEEQKLFLHFSWATISHVEDGRGIKFYGGSLLRLKKLLKKRA